MAGDDLPGPVETAVFAAPHRGALASRCNAAHVVALRDEPAGEYLLHEILGRCEQQGLVRSHWDASSRRWTLTPAGRARLLARSQFGRALATLVARSRVGVR